MNKKLSFEASGKITEIFFEEDNRTKGELLTKANNSAETTNGRITEYLK
jgi:hypothetical protein